MIAIGFEGMLGFKNSKLNFEIIIIEIHQKFYNSFQIKIKISNINYHI